MSIILQSDAFRTDPHQIKRYKNYQVAPINKSSNRAISQQLLPVFVKQTRSYLEVHFSSNHQSISPGLASQIAKRLYRLIMPKENNNQSTFQ